MTYTITLTNNGVDPAAATVTDSSAFRLHTRLLHGNRQRRMHQQLSGSELLPAAKRRNADRDPGCPAGSSIPDGTVTTNTVSISNSSAVDANAANNSASCQGDGYTACNCWLGGGCGKRNLRRKHTLSATLTTRRPFGRQDGQLHTQRLANGSAVTDATGLASVSASLVGIAAGSYPAGVTASFAGDANNTAASRQREPSPSIPAVLTVTSADATRIYGDPNPALASPSLDS